MRLLEARWPRTRVEGLGPPGRLHPSCRGHRGPVRSNWLGAGPALSIRAAVIEEVFPQGNGRSMVGAFSFTVDGQVYRGQDEESPTAGRGDRTWSGDELQGMRVCYDPERPGEDFALAPARYRCGDPEIITTDGGW